MESVPIITIDGPSGSGKGTIASRVAAELGYHLLDSGALYRVLGYVAHTRKLDLQQPEQLVELANTLDIQFGNNGPGSVAVDGVDLSLEIRSKIGSEMASKVAVIPAARDALYQRQLAFRKAPGLVADGRDMGTVVFPEAQVKIFLTASAEERAKRRYKQLIGKGISAILPDLLQELNERDERDSSRAVSPLTPAAEALILDSTTLSIDEVVAKVLLQAQTKLG